MTPPVLLLHGQPGRAGDWAGVVRELGGEARLVVPDRPGYGNNPAPAVGFAANADAAAALLDAPTVVAGHSWGAGVALALAARRPELVAGLVLVAPVTPYDAYGLADRALGAPRTGRALWRLALAGAGTALALSRVDRAAARRLPAASPTNLNALGRSWRSSRAARSAHVEQRALLDELPGLAPAVERIDFPAIVLLGAADRFVDRASVERLARVTGADLVPLARTGHLVPAMKPGEVARAIRRLRDGGAAVA